MKKKKIIFGVSAGVISIAIDGIAGVLNIHLFLRFLPVTIAGFWLLLLAVGGLLLMIPSSILPTVTRFIAQRVGKDRNSSGKPGEVVTLVGWITLIIATMSVSVFFVYLWPIAERDNVSKSASLAWLLYSGGLIFSLHATANFAVLNGIGEVGWDKVIRCTTSVLGIGLTLVSLMIGASIAGLGAAFLIQNSIAFIAARRLVTRFTSNSYPASELSSTNAIKQLSIETLKLLSLAAVGYLAMNLGTFVVQRRFGSEEVAKYAPLVRVGALLANTALMITQTAYPYVAQSWSQRDFEGHRKLFVLGIVGAIAVYIVGATLMWAVAPYAFPLWLGHGRYLGPEVFGLILLVYGIFVASVSCSNPVLASVGSAFLRPSLLSLILVAPMLWLFTGWFGIVGAPLGTIIGMLGPSTWIAFSSWKQMVRHRHVSAGSAGEV